MARTRRTWIWLMLAQAVLLAVGWSLFGTGSLRAQKRAAPPGIHGHYDTYASNPDGSSPTQGTLPPHRPGYHYLSVPSSAFHPAANDYVFENYGKGIIREDSLPSQFQVYVAPLYLPQGAVVTELMMVGGDVVPDQPGNRDGAMAFAVIQSELDRLAADPPSEREIGLVLSYPNTANLGVLGIYTATATLETPVDNENYAYLMKVDLPTNGLLFRSARIEYYIPTELYQPVLLKNASQN